jgi:hypothetical protein
MIPALIYTLKKLTKVGFSIITYRKTCSVITIASNLKLSSNKIAINPKRRSLSNISFSITSVLLFVNFPIKFLEKYSND